MGMNIAGVPYALASSIVDFPASEIRTSDAKIISCKFSTNPKFFTFSYFFELMDLKLVQFLNLD